jgi:stage III sporulation protein AD
MGALQIGAVGLLMAVTAVLLKDLGWRGAAVFSAFSLVALLSLCTEGILKISGAVSDFASQSALSEAAAGVLKITGVGFLMGATADVCRELGEGGIARGVILAGRLEILCIALPFLQKIVAIGMELLK